jgi:hypothetical protein
MSNGIILIIRKSETEDRDVLVESQAGVLADVWSRVELRHEFGPIYKFHIHNL